MKNYYSIIFLFCCSLAFGQDYKVVWQQCYGDEGDNHYMAICPTSDGYLFAYNNYSGENTTNFHGAMDIWIQRFDTLHNRIWERCYGGSNSEVPIKLIRINDSEFYLLGCSLSSDGDVQSKNNEFSEVWVTKISIEGNIIWSKTYGCDGDDDPRDMVLTPDGGFVFMDRIGWGGGDVTNFYGLGDVWLCKCDSMGNIEWEKTLGNDGLDNGLSLLINSKGNIMMLGAAQKTGGMITCIPDGSWADVWLVELDMQGNIVWQECYGGSEYDCGLNLVEIDDGYIFTSVSCSNDGDVSGHHGPASTMPPYSDLWLVRLDSTGEIVWQKSLGGTDNEESTFLSISSTRKIVIIGSTDSHDGDVSGNHSLPNGYDRDVWLLHVNMDGELLSQQCIGSSWDDVMIFYNVIQKTDHEFLISAGIQQRPADGDVQCSFYHYPYTYYDVWLFELKDCNHFAPHTPSQPTGPTHACSASGEPGRYTVPAITNQTHAWHLEPSEAGTLTTHGDTLTVLWTTTFEGTATLTARGVNDCGESGWSVPFYTEVETCAGIATHPLSGLRLWPNPANGSFNLQLPAGATLPATLALSDLSGRIVLRQPLTETLSTIDCSKLVEGVYFWRVSLGDDRATGKIMIQNSQ
jgi:hypothetical protein